MSAEADTSVEVRLQRLEEAIGALLARFDAMADEGQPDDPLRAAHRRFRGRARRRPGDQEA